MTVTCEEHLTAMVPYLRDELEPLPRARLESHLGHCAVCASVRDEMSAGLRAARAWQPELSNDELEHRLERLAPYMESRPERASLRVAWLAGAVATFALVVALGMVVWPDADNTPVVEEPTTVFDFSDGVAFDVPGEPALSRHQPSAHVRLIAPRDWDGSMVREGRRTVIEMSRGFVAVAFEGGRGRRLRVNTPGAQIDVVGTRFVVDIADGVTTVAVFEGKVRVRAGGRTTMVSAGQACAADGHATQRIAEAPASAVHLKDDFLALPAPPRAPRRAVPRDQPVAISDVLDQLARAENLANDDQVAAAVTIFESCADDSDAAYDPYRDLCRLQRARLLGFRQGRTRVARSLLQDLARGGGQVASEAAVTLCELDLERDPCRTRACLEAIGSSSDASAAREAAELLGRWHLTEVACP